MEGSGRSCEVLRGDTIWWEVLGVGGSYWEVIRGSDWEGLEGDGRCSVIVEGSGWREMKGGGERWCEVVERGVR